MKRNAIPLLLSLLLLIACGGKEALPDGVMPPEDMTAFLTDLHLTEGYYEAVVHNTCDSSVYDSLLHLHGITRTDFDSSISYYNRHEQEFLAIYDEVLRRIDSMNNAINSI